MPRMGPEPSTPRDEVTFINATSHDITLITATGNTTLPTSGLFARVARQACGLSTLQGKTTTADHVEVNIIELRPTSTIDDLPDPQPGVVYIVSQLTALAARHRTDVVFPHDEVRDTAGRLMGVRSFAKFTNSQ